MSSADFAPRLLFLDLPRFEAGDATGFARVAAMPSRGGACLSPVRKAPRAFAPRTRLEKPASIGRLTAPLASGISGRFDRVNSIEADFLFASLSSADRPAVLNGANRLAVRAGNGAFEIIGFASAEETAPGHWRLTNLLRGLAGTEDAMQAGRLGRRGCRSAELGGLSGPDDGRAGNDAETGSPRPSVFPVRGPLRSPFQAVFARKRRSPLCIARRDVLAQASASAGSGGAGSRRMTGRPRIFRSTNRMSATAWKSCRVARLFAVWR